MAAGTHIRQVGDGVYRVEIDGRAETVYVAGTPRDRWVSGTAACSAETFSRPSPKDESIGPRRARREA